MQILQHDYPAATFLRIIEGVSAPACRLGEGAEQCGLAQACAAENLLQIDALCVVIFHKSAGFHLCQIHSRLSSQIHGVGVGN